MENVKLFFYEPLEWVSAANDSCELGVSALQVESDPLIKTAVDRLLSVGETTFAIEEKKSGLYVASRLVPRFAAPKLIIPPHLISTRLTYSQLEHKRLPPPHRRLS